MVSQKLFVVEIPDTRHRCAILNLQPILLRVTVNDYTTILKLYTLDVRIVVEHLNTREHEIQVSQVILCVLLVCGAFIDLGVGVFAFLACGFARGV